MGVQERQAECRPGEEGILGHPDKEPLQQEQSA